MTMRAKWKRAKSKAKRQAVDRRLHPVVQIPNLETYVPGKGCNCAAYDESECGCVGVDWTPREVYELRAKLQIAMTMKENLFAAIEKLRLAGQRGHDYGCAYDGRAPLEWCDCGAKEINAQVDAAAEMLVAEIRGQNPTGQAARKKP